MNKSILIRYLNFRLIELFYSYVSHIRQCRISISLKCGVRFRNSLTLSIFIKFNLLPIWFFDKNFKMHENTRKHVI